MFDRIVLRHSESGSPVSFGEIAEALVFYRKVHLVLDGASIAQLVRAVGFEHFFRLMELDRITVAYVEQHLGVYSERAGLAERYNFVAFQLEGKAPGRLGRSERLALTFSRLGCDKRQANRYADRLLRKAKVRSMAGDDFVPGGVIKAAKEDLVDQRFLRQAVDAAISRGLSASSPSCPNYFFEVVDFGRHFEVATDLDLKRVNAFSGQSGDGHEVTVPGLLSNVLTARSDLAVASHYGGDFRTSRISSEILRVKHADLLRRSGLNSHEISSFNEVVLEDLPGVAEVLDQGGKSPHEFFQLLEASSKFASWTAGLSPDEKLVSEYFKSATSPSWIASLPGKTTRFVIGLAVGGLGPVAGAIASFADSFVIDRMLGGWRPSHFVDRKLKPFLRESQ